jgi:uncharacterized protein
MQEIGIVKTRKRLQRFALVALGWILVVGGIAGLFLPIVPGVLLLALAAVILNPQYAWLQRASDKCRGRFPVLERYIRPFSAWAERWNRRFGNDLGDSGSQ